MHSRASNNDEQQPLTARTSDAPQASSVASAVDEAPSERSASRAHRPRARPPSLARPFTPQRKCAGSSVFTLQRSGPRLNFSRSKITHATCGERVPGLPASSEQLARARISADVYVRQESAECKWKRKQMCVTRNCIAKIRKVLSRETPSGEAPHDHEPTDGRDLTLRT